ncbi:MAG: chorismate-binding protein [Bdellovibrionales bacterium]|nr:chorismate-binding protein [Bdellovibrionales bacterium]
MKLSPTIIKKQTSDINKNQWEKEGFLIQIKPRQYLLGEGPFSLSSKPEAGQWSLFYPPFFFSHRIHNSQGKIRPSGYKSLANTLERPRSYEKTVPDGYKSLANTLERPRSYEKTVPDGYKKAYWYIPYATAFFSKQKLEAFLGPKKEKIYINDKNRVLPSKSLFKSFFLKSQEQIKKNKIQKVVPVFFETSPFSLEKKDISSLIYYLITCSHKGGIAYGWWSNKQAILGYTPEYLFKKDALFVQTMALAGTARSAQHDLKKDQKERWEHQLVIEEIKKQLKPLGKSHLSDTYIYSVGNISHLRTDFKLQLTKNISFEQLCCLLHPTPALGGVPRKPALNLLAELHKENNLRYGFGSPFGVAKGDKAFCVVAIRNVQFINGKMYIGSGFGLVKGSQMEREWEELRKKRQIIKDILFST